MPALCYFSLRQKGLAGEIKKSGARIKVVFISGSNSVPADCEEQIRNERESAGIVQMLRLKFDAPAYKHNYKKAHTAARTFNKISCESSLKAQRMAQINFLLL